MILEIAYKNEPRFPTPGKKLGCYFQSETCLVALETHVFLSFL